MTEPDAPILEAISNRRSPRAFAEREPTTAELASIFEAARWASSCFNEQPWRYIVARRSEGEIHAKALEGLNPFNRAWAAAAPVIGFSLARVEFGNGKPNRHAWHDVGAATTQAAIQAASMGLVIHQMAGIEAEVVRAHFDVPEELEVVAGFALGWPGDPASLPEPLREREQAPRTRRPLSELLLRGSL